MRRARREEPDPLGFSRRNPVLQALAGLVLTVPLAILLTSLWPRLERHGIATMMLIWSGLAARAAHHAWRAWWRSGAVRWREPGPLLLRIAAGMGTLAAGGVVGAIVLLIG